MTSLSSCFKAIQRSDAALFREVAGKQGIPNKLLLQAALRSRQFPFQGTDSLEDLCNKLVHELRIALEPEKAAELDRVVTAAQAQVVAEELRGHASRERKQRPKMTQPAFLIPVAAQSVPTAESILEQLIAAAQPQQEPPPQSAEEMELFEEEKEEEPQRRPIVRRRMIEDDE